MATLYEYTMGELQKKDKRLLVALDDVDFLFHVNVAENILYKILRAHEIFPGVKTGIIGIVTDNAFSFKVSEKLEQYSCQMKFTLSPTHDLQYRIFLDIVVISGYIRE